MCDMCKYKLKALTESSSHIHKRCTGLRNTRIVEVTKLGNQKEERYVNWASAEGKAIKRHPFQMSNAWEKNVGSQSLLCPLLTNLFFVRCLCKISSLVELWDQAWLGVSACNIVSGCSLTALALKFCKEVFVFFLTLLKCFVYLMSLALLLLKFSLWLVIIKYL